MNATDLLLADTVSRLVTLTADHLDQRAATYRYVSLGLVRDAIAAASDSLLRRDLTAGSGTIDAARIKMYDMLPPTAGTVTEYVAQLRTVGDAETARLRGDSHPMEGDDLEGEHEECFGIHNSADGYCDCDGNLI